MARGGRGRGGRRGSNPDQSRGRGRGDFGGRGNGRGRGRGGGGQTYVTLDDFDFPIQQWPSNDPPNTGGFRGFGGPRARGRGRGAYSLSGTGTNTPQRGFSSPRGLGRGESNVLNGVRQMYGKPQNYNPGAPLSKQLYQSNILLKPIKFVRSVHTATLFTQTEEIFQPVVEAAVDGDEKSHVPTADSVSRIFKAAPENVDHSSGGEEELEEFDFADIGKIQAAVDAGRAADAPVKAPQAVAAKEQMAFFVDTTPMAILSAARGRRIATNQVQGTLGEPTDDDDVIVYVAPHPRHDRSTATPAPVAPAEPIAPAFIPTTSIITGLPIGSAAPSTSYVPGPTDRLPASQLPSAFELSLDTLFPEEAPPAPEPSNIGVAPDAADLPPPPLFDNFAFSSLDTATPKKQARRLHPVGTPRSLLKHSRKARRKPLRGFGSYGAMHEEALLHEVDPRRAEQRRGDSDVNWGDSDEEDGVEELSTGIGDMEIDESIDLAAMKKFVHSMSAEGSRHVTMDDVADMERMRQEDEEEPVRGAESAEEEEAGASKKRGEPAASDDESESDSGDEEVDAIIRAGEAELIGESEEEGATRSGKAARNQNGMGGEGSGEGQRSEEDEDEDEESDEDEDDEEDSDDEETPKRGFQARLERLRSTPSKGKGKARARDSDDSSDEAMSVQMTWADEDDDFIDTIEAILLENQDILQSRNRKEKKKLFKAIRDGTFESDKFADSMTPAKRAKDKDMPPELREQWEKDRAKKAENKRKRALERIQLAADPLAQHKGGKKGRKAMLAAARADGDADLPNRVTDIVSLEQQIRRFLADIGGSNTMALPPAHKETRAQVHQLAMAFNLKSQSKGKGNTRYTTLTKTSKSGVGIQEGKIRHILRQATGGAWQGAGGGKGRSKTMSLATHREGEEVGKEAPKIGASNLGFKMLAAMGWSDGDRIGLSGGLDAPLTAIMKKTKLGLGASMRS